MLVLVCVFVLVCVVFLLVVSCCTFGCGSSCVLSVVCVFCQCSFSSVVCRVLSLRLVVVR